MRRLFPVLFVALVVAVLTTTSFTQAQESPIGCLPLAVATTPLTPGQPLPANSITLTGIDGAEIVSAAFEEPSAVIPTGYPGRSIVRSLSGEHGVLTADGTVIPLSALTDSGPVQLNGPGFTSPAGSRYVFFNALVDLTAWLVDLETGETTILSDVIESSERLIGGSIAANGAWAAAWTGGEIYLFDLAGGSPAVAIGEGDFLGFPYFSDDGSTLFYTRGQTRELSQILARDLATGEESVIQGQNSWFGLTKFPGDILVAQVPGMLYRIDTGGSASMIMQSSLEMRPLVIDPTGSNVLVELEDGNSSHWALVDLSGTSALELQELAGSFLVHFDQQASWALFSPIQVPGPAVPGAPYHSLDLETGTVTPVLEQTGDGVYFSNSPSSAGGRFATVWSTAPGQGLLWLIDAEQGSADLVAESPGNATGLVSPDGCYLAISTFNALGEGRQGQVQVVDLHTSETVLQIEDALLLGWASI